jgi:hypothetical protein
MGGANLATSVSEKLMQTNLHLESLIPQLLINLQVFLGNKWNRFIRALCTKNIPQTDVLEAFVLPDIVVVGNVNASGNARSSKGKHF